MSKANLPMEVELVKKDDKIDYSATDYLEFKWRNVDNSLANGIRRVLLAEIPLLAIDTVNIRSNTSVLHDEMLSHRLGLVPISSGSCGGMPFPLECECKQQGCTRCQVEITLNVRCESHEHSRKVYSSDLVSADPDKVAPVAYGQGIWLCTLGRGQEIDLQCFVRKGIAKTHARFQAVATVAMIYTPDIHLNQDGFAQIDPMHRREWVDRCPRRVFAFDEHSQQVIVANKHDCIYCKECLARDGPFENVAEALVSVKQKRNHKGQFDFVFQVEGTGALPVVPVVQSASQVLIAKLRKLRTKVEELKKQTTGDTIVDTTQVAPLQGDDFGGMVLA